MIVYKPTPNDHTPDVLKPFSRELNMSIIEQTEGGIDDAMNLIFQNATGDILLTTDDDEIPDENWVNDHVIS
ncbi:glycosyltransferase [Sulfuracidifex metallicus]|uniref:glycosyltransferase n=1 Tax=Sulfuracidifex metallicus TaxID=47303 RepID=UPI00210D3E2A|nr:glycosyltransferase family A protein [Sulfuracidifex metallicus]